MHPTRTLGTLVACAAMLLEGGGAAFAQSRPIGVNNQPDVNLGFTSFLDGAPPHRDEAFYFQQYLQYYTSDRFHDVDGDRPPVPDDPEIDVWAWITQLVYQSDQELLLGGRWGFNLVVPVIFPDLDGGTLPITDNHGGVGDIWFGPALQWGPIMGEHGPLMTHRLELAWIFPTGSYSRDDAVNPGSNFYSFNPYWAGTLFLGPRITTSWRLHYLWNGKNPEPNNLLFPGASDTQAGQAVHANFTAAYAVIPQRLRLGLNGYFLRQLTEFEVDGRNVDGSREQVVALGPGGVFHLSPRDTFFLNVYFEFAAENRTQGTRALVRYVRQF